jgi:predicted RNase H-like nuclease (RuvC/YqgF family)
MVKDSSITKENKGSNTVSILNLIFKLIIAGALLYIIVQVLKPNRGNQTISMESKRKIDSLNNVIETIEKKQEILYLEVKTLNEALAEIDVRISNIKQEKITIKQIYHEKINAVNNYNDAELDSLFSKRYGSTY